jgi:peptide/nickel transport system permease protein
MALSGRMNLLRFVLKRIILAVPLMIGLLTLTFFIIRWVPGDPVAAYIDPAMNADDVKHLRSQYGLDESVGVQYGKWIGFLSPYEGILQGELGMSWSRRKPVTEVIAEALPNTLILTGTAFIIDILLGVFIGIGSAMNHRRWPDRWLRGFSLFFYSMPHFWLGLILIMIFSLWLGWLPVSQMHSVNADLLSPFGYGLDLIRHLILPAAVLGIASAASTARYMRNSMLETLNQDYIRTARAKGLPERIVILKHALRNALIPLITLVGLSIPFLLSGAVITEVVFAWPGMGRVTVEAIFSRDYPLIIANTLLGGIMVIAGNLLADILYVWADPRIRLSR